MEANATDLINYEKAYGKYTLDNILGKDASCGGNFGTIDGSTNFGNNHVENELVEQLHGLNEKEMNSINDLIGELNEKPSEDAEDAKKAALKSKNNKSQKKVKKLLLALANLL